MAVGCVSTLHAAPRASPSAHPSAADRPNLKSWRMLIVSPVCPGAWQVWSTEPCKMKRILGAVGAQMNGDDCENTVVFLLSYALDPFKCTARSVRRDKALLQLSLLLVRQETGSYCPEAEKSQVFFQVISTKMDPLSITAGVVASLQVACSVLGYCYGVRSQMQKMPWTLIQIIEEVRNLRNLIEALESILCGGEFSDNPGNHSAQKSETLPRGIEPIISDCLAELRRLETRIRPEMVDLVLGSKRKALTQALSWRLKGDDAKESIRSLQRCKDALNLALNSHNSLVIQLRSILLCSRSTTNNGSNSLILRKVERLSLSLDHKMDLSQQQIGVLTADIGTAQLGMCN